VLIRRGAAFDADPVAADAYHQLTRETEAGRPRRLHLSVQIVEIVSFVLRAAETIGR
jgi:hypothetical protein